jgi:hypothetical protein
MFRRYATNVHHAPSTVYYPEVLLSGENTTAAIAPAVDASVGSTGSWGVWLIANILYMGWRGIGRLCVTGGQAVGCGSG